MHFENNKDFICVSAVKLDLLNVHQPQVMKISL